MYSVCEWGTLRTSIRINAKMQEEIKIQQCKKKISLVTNVSKDSLKEEIRETEF